MNVLSLFDGMSCGQLALRRAGISYDTYYASEIDKDAIKITNTNFPKTVQLGDVTKIKSNYLPKIDILFGGSPCQSFSIAGGLEGFNGKSGLFYEFVRILREVNPTYFLFENVKMKKEWKYQISKELGVEPVLINSNLVSGQDRERLYWANFQITQPADKQIYMRDIVEQYSREWLPILPWTQKVWGTKKKIDCLRTIDSKKSFCLTTNKSHSKNYYLSPDKTKLTKLTSKEAEKLQTLPEGYTSCISEGKAFKAIGNGWTVEVIAHILSGINNQAASKQLTLF